MSNPNSPPDDLTPVEANLGKVLALIHKVLPRLDDSARRTDVQSALSQAIKQLEVARSSCASRVRREMPPGRAAQMR